MIKVYQTKFINTEEERSSGGYGDCLSACAASILEIPLKEVPLFVSHGSEWFSILRKWLLVKKLKICMFRKGIKPIGWSVMTGNSPRGSWPHSVVAFNGEFFHDPHPLGNGLAGEPEYYMQFTSIDEKDPPEGGYFYPV